jgi:hypothetical protein
MTARFAHKANAVALWVFALFGLVVAGFGAALALLSGRVNDVRPDLPALSLIVVGVVAAVIGGWMLVRGVRGLGAVSSIEIDGDGNWILRSFTGVRGTIPAAEGCRIELRGYRVISSVTSFRRDDVVAGRVTFDSGKSFRLARSGPHTFNEALAVLGAEPVAPAPGETATVDLTA